MEVEDTNLDHDDINEDAVFKTAVSEVTTDLNGETVEDNTRNSDRETESELDPLGQEADNEATKQSDEEPDEIERLKAENERLHHSINSEKGRTRAALKRWKETQDRLGQATQELDVDPQGLIDDDFRDNFPELSEELEKSMARSAERTNQTIKAALDPMQSLVDGELESLQQESQLAAEMAVEQAIPEARQILQDPQFSNWLNSQPAGVQGLFSSDDPQDAIYLLSQFKSSPSPGSDVRERRDKQKRSLSAASRSATPKDNAELDDEDAIWSDISKQVFKDFGNG